MVMKAGNGVIVAILVFSNSYERKQREEMSVTQKILRLDWTDEMRHSISFFFSEVIT